MIDSTWTDAPALVNVVAAVGGHTHRVSEPVLAGAVAVGAPVRAQCGQLIMPASLAQPFGRSCQLCVPVAVPSVRRTARLAGLLRRGLARPASS